MRLSNQDEDNGLVLRLTIDKKEYSEGETIRATASLENVTEVDMAVHYLDMRPTYLRILAGDVPFDPVEWLEGWRGAYSNLSILRQRIPGGLAGSALATIGPNPRGKQWTKEFMLQIVSHHTLRTRFPQSTVRAGSTVTATMTFSASKDHDYVDVGLFGPKEFYDSDVLAMSGKTLPKIWLGALYAYLPIHVK